MKNKNIKWLYEELPALISKGILTQENALEIKKYYGEINERNWLKIMLGIFGTLGAILIGSGIILIFAKNWDTLSIPVRTVLSFAPLVIAQLVGIYVIYKKNDSLAWKEGTSAFIALSVGAAISLIGQTYNISGDTSRFLITWMLLILPLIYIFNAFTPSFFYLAGITIWSGFEQSTGSNATLFWAFLTMLLPFIIKAFKTLESNRSVLLLWLLTLDLVISLGIVLEKVLPGLWIVIYSSFFSVLFLLENNHERETDSVWQRPFLVAGTMGIPVISIILSFKGFWNNIGWLHYRHEARFNVYAGIIDYILVAVLLSGAVYLFFRSFKRKDLTTLVFGFSSLLSSICYLLSSALQDGTVPVILYNIYILAIGLITIVYGIRNKHMGITNGGMLIISCLIVMRFFDVELSFLVKGLSFIFVGAGFIISNAVLIKKQKEVSSYEKTS